MNKARIHSEVVKIDVGPMVSIAEPTLPIHWSKPRAIDWVRRILVRTRGKEFPGNFNPLLN